jgi:hypothetical protein
MLQALLPLLSGYSKGKQQQAQQAEQKEMLGLQKQQMQLQLVKEKRQSELMNAVLAQFQAQQQQQAPEEQKPSPVSANTVNLGETFGTAQPQVQQGGGGLPNAMAQGQMQMDPNMAMIMQMNGMPGFQYRDALKPTEISRTLRQFQDENGDIWNQNQDIYGNPVGNPWLRETPRLGTLTQEGPGGNRALLYHPRTGQPQGALPLSPPELIPSEAENEQGQTVRTFRTKFGPLEGGGGGGTPGGQVVKQGFMSTSDLGNLRTPDGGRMPIGTTKADAIAAGALPESGAEESMTLGMRNAKIILDQMQELSGKIGGAEGEWDRPYEALKMAGKSVTQSDPNVAVYDGMRGGVLSLIVRALGEKGTLSDMDIKRAAQLIPSKYDTNPVREKKFKAVSALISKIGNPNATPEEMTVAYTSALNHVGGTPPPGNYPAAQWSDQAKGWVIQKDGQWFRIKE